MPKNIGPKNIESENRETTKPQYNTAHERLQAVYRLQRRYRITGQDMAFLLGVQPDIYLRRLKKAGLNSNANSLPQLDIEDLLMKINTELQNFSKADGLPEKKRG